jgi:uncharacterized protein (TIGR03118 family)
MDISCKHLAHAAIVGCVGLAALAGPVAFAQTAQTPITVVTFSQTNLVSSVPGLAPVTDPALIGPRGIASFFDGFFWMPDSGNGTLSLYGGGGQTAGVSSPVVPNTPSAPPGTPSAPSGVAVNISLDFAFQADGQILHTSLFIPTENGVIDVWSPSDFFNAHLVIDNSASGALYKGVAFAESKSNLDCFFVTNFHAGTIEIYNRVFFPVTVPGGFVDNQIPPGFVPFGINQLDGELWVTYALQDGAKAKDVPGPGNGFVNVFDGDGNLVRRFASGFGLNSPWAIIRAPSSFGQFAGDILIGNRGDGTISAFDNQGIFLGQLRRADGSLLQIDGLAGLSTGNSFFSSVENVYFNAGPNNETEGLFGLISATPITLPTLPGITIP